MLIIDRAIIICGNLRILVISAKLLLVLSVVLALDHQQGVTIHLTLPTTQPTINTNTNAVCDTIAKLAHPRYKRGRVGLKVRTL
jgi:hypothetical protein